jgi:hypothetical protein
MPEIDYKEIKKWLPRGEVKKLAKEHGISVTSASLCLSGKVENFSFMERAIKRATEHKAKIIGAMNQMKSLNPTA